MFVARKNFILPALAVAGGLFLFLFHPLWGGPKPTVPKAVQKKALEATTAGGFLEDSLLFQQGTLGTITGMAFIPAGVDSQPVIVAAGPNGAAYFSAKGELRSTVKFERKGVQMVPVGLKGDGDFVFMNRGGDGQQVGLFDSTGRLAWRYGLGVDPIPSDMAAGDLDGDGELEYVVGMKGEGGIHLLDAHGKKKWIQPDVNIWHVEILDVDGDGKKEIVYSNAAGRVRLRDGSGKLLRELKYDAYVGQFTPCRWPDAQGSWFLLNNNKREGLQLLDFKGKALTRFDIPARGQAVFAAPVRLAPKTEPYFALLVCDCIPNHETRLYLLDPAGNIVFETDYPTFKAALLTVPGQIPGTDNLLVGEQGGGVWQIRWKPAEPAQRN